MIINDVQTPIQIFVDRERDRRPPEAEFKFIDLFAGIGDGTSVRARWLLPLS